MGFVYFIAVDESYVKIGYSRHPYRRFLEVQAYNPTRLSLLGVMEGSIKEERRLHRVFRDQHVRNEWFCYDQTLKHFIDQNCELPDFWDLEEVQWPSLNLSFLRRNLTQVLDQVERDECRVVVKKRGRAVAAVIPIADLRLLEQLEEFTGVAQAQ